MGVSGGGAGWRWPAAGLRALSAAVRAWNLLKEVTIIFITSTRVWPQINIREEHSSTHQQKVGLKIYFYNGLKTISLTSGAGKTGQPLVKE